MKKIKLFLVATEDDLAEDRMAISDLIGTLNDKYEEKGLYFQVVKPKSVPAESDLAACEEAFILWFHHSDEITAASFEQALSAFQKSGKPKIITYFKQSAGVDVADDVGGFMERLDKDLGHYYNLYEHIDSLRFSLLMQISALESSISLECKNGDVLLDGEKYLSLYDVPCAAGNKALSDLKATLKKATAKFFELRELYADDEDNEELASQYMDASEQRRMLREQVAETEKNILAAALSMARDTAAGALSDRQKEAYRLFEKGDYEGANAVLDFGEIKEEIKQTEAVVGISIEMLTARRNELLQKTKILLSCATGKSSDWNEIYPCYQEAIRLEEKYNLPKWAMYQQIMFFLSYSFNKSALEQSEKLIAYLTLQEDSLIPMEDLQVTVAELERRQGHLAKSTQAARTLLHKWSDQEDLLHFPKCKTYLSRLCLILANISCSTACWQEAYDFCERTAMYSVHLSEDQREQTGFVLALTELKIVLEQKTQDMTCRSREGIVKIAECFAQDPAKYAGYQMVSQFLQGKYCWLLHQEEEAWRLSLSAYDLAVQYGSLHSEEIFQNFFAQLLIQLVWIGFETNRLNCSKYLKNQTMHKEVWHYPKDNPYLPNLLQAKKNLLAALLLQREQGVMDDRYNLVDVGLDFIGCVQREENDNACLLEEAECCLLLSDWYRIGGNVQLAIRYAEEANKIANALCDQSVPSYLGVWFRGKLSWVNDYVSIGRLADNLEQGVYYGSNDYFYGEQMVVIFEALELDKEVEALWNPIILQPELIDWMLLTAERFDKSERNAIKACEWLMRAKRQLSRYIEQVGNNDRLAVRLVKQAADQEAILSLAGDPT